MKKLLLIIIAALLAVNTFNFITNHKQKVKLERNKKEYIFLSKRCEGLEELVIKYLDGYMNYEQLNLDTVFHTYPVSGNCYYRKKYRFDYINKKAIEHIYSEDTVFEDCIIPKVDPSIVKLGLIGSFIGSSEEYKKAVADSSALVIPSEKSAVWYRARTNNCEELASN